MREEAYRAYAKGISHMLQAGQLTLPYVLLKHYKRLGLTESETMLIIQLIGYKQVEEKDFPSLDELQQRMAMPSNMVTAALQRLIKDGFLSIDEHVDEATHVQYEHYNWTGLWERLGQLLSEDIRVQHEQQKASQDMHRGGQPELNLFEIFEKEFGRPLSPMEYETIGGWIDDDRYSQALILLALKEAVFAGKIHFRYIDRILLEWSRNKITTTEEARAYTQKFRGNRS
ncbi:DnaD domain-containing protein [Paenibacillus aquistagni]|uniref:DnaD domain-containing protein n=1 Tax=Paenibacillus aquistagni TaxID=1852522 RepID=UPI00145B5C11|nr:DnaD domain protein [Paenibacillus aquistagni]NMM54185.1 DnaD domain protein [Paenibacillus aquistagni]